MPCGDNRIPNVPVWRLACIIGRADNLISHLERVGIEDNALEQGIQSILRDAKVALDCLSPEEHYNNITNEEVEGIESE